MAIEKQGLIAIAFSRPCRVRHFPVNADEYGFAVVRWRADAIAILIISEGLITNFVLFNRIFGCIEHNGYSTRPYEETSDELVDCSCACSGKS